MLVYMKKVRSEFDYRRCNSDFQKILTDHVVLLIAHLSRLKSKYLNLISMSYCILKSVVYVGLHEKKLDRNTITGVVIATSKRSLQIM